MSSSFKSSMELERPVRLTQLEYMDHTGYKLLKGGFGLRLVRDIGSGYAGVVYKCLRTSKGASKDQYSNWMAVKVMNKKKVKPEQVEREAALLRMSGGKGVIDYVTAVECIDSYLLVTEYCARGDLHGMLPYMDKNHVMAREYLRQVAGGLSRLHDKLIQHGDVKMRNIVVDGNNVPKLADFGFATLHPHRRAKTTVCQGTKDYWAPEMWAPAPYFCPFKADIYALALTFLGVCECRPIKRKDNDLEAILNRIKNPDQKELFTGLLNVNPRERSKLDVIYSNPWMLATVPASSITPPPSP